MKANTVLVRLAEYLSGRKINLGKEIYNPKLPIVFSFPKSVAEFILCPKRQSLSLEHERC